MVQDTWAHCPFCGTKNQILTANRLTIVGSTAMNVSVECGGCGRDFDAAPGGPGTFSSIGGRLRRVASALAHADEDELTALLEALRQAERESAGPERTAELVEQAAPRLGALNLWLKGHQHLAGWGQLLLGLIMLVLYLLGPDAPGADDPGRETFTERGLEAAENCEPLAPEGKRRDDEQQGGGGAPHGSLDKHDEEHGQQQPEERSTAVKREHAPTVTGSGSHVHLPEGSEGTIHYPDGMIVRWGPGTRPTLRRH